ncbi:transferase [Cryomorphaceae bacterium]|nr:transferase [Cryomorphaceae bacterium]
MSRDQKGIDPSAEIHELALIEENVEIGANTIIGPFCIIREGAKIGSNCKLTAYCEMRENVTVGDHTSFGSRCTISANASVGSRVSVKYGFVLADTPNLQEGDNKSVGSIHDGALIGANVTLMPGFSIGKNAIIGACSQVRSNVGDHEIWYGNPAKFFKKND